MCNNNDCYVYSTVDARPLKARPRSAQTQPQPRGTDKLG